MIVGPRNAVAVKQVEDRPAGRVVEQVAGRVVDEAVRGSGDQEAAVGEGGSQARAEPAVGDREGAGQAVVERQVVFGPVAHADRRAGALARGPVDVARGRDDDLGAGDEPVVLPLIPLVMGGMPALRRHVRPLDGRRQVMRPDGLAVGVPVGCLGLAVGAERETVAAIVQHAQVVVVGVVLHHQHDDVLDLRQQVGPDRAGGLRWRPGGRAAAVSRPAFAPGPFGALRHVSCPYPG